MRSVPLAPLLLQDSCQSAVWIDIFTTFIMPDMRPPIGEYFLRHVNLLQVLLSKFFKNFYGNRAFGTEIAVLSVTPVVKGGHADDRRVAIGVTRRQKTFSDEFSVTSQGDAFIRRKTSKVWREAVPSEATPSRNGLRLVSESVLKYNTLCVS